ncbi:MAG: hypothetical protein IRZ08_01645 [Frankia sp.]|nr:hypothetical protein [Frankia sp.]
MPAEIFGLPSHALIVHATVVLVPLTALLLVLCALWPRLRRALGPLPAIAALAMVILVPITTESGESLRDRLLFEPEGVARHADLASGLLPWVAGMFVAALLLLFADGWRPTAWASPSPSGTAGGHRAAGARRRPAALALVASVLVIGLAVGSVVQVVRVGHSGAEAVWEGIGVEPA